MQSSVLFNLPVWIWNFSLNWNENVCFIERSLPSEMSTLFFFLPMCWKVNCSCSWRVKIMCVIGAKPCRWRSYHQHQGVIGHGRRCREAMAWTHFSWLYASLHSLSNLLFLQVSLCWGVFLPAKSGFSQLYLSILYFCQSLLGISCKTRPETKAWFLPSISAPCFFPPALFFFFLL